MSPIRPSGKSCSGFPVDPCERRVLRHASPIEELRDLLLQGNTRIDCVRSVNTHGRNVGFNIPLPKECRAQSLQQVHVQTALREERLSAHHHQDLRPDRRDLLDFHLLDVPELERLLDELRPRYRQGDNGSRSITDHKGRLEALDRSQGRSNRSHQVFLNCFVLLVLVLSREGSRVEIAPELGNFMNERKLSEAHFDCAVWKKRRDLAIGGGHFQLYCARVPTTRQVQHLHSQGGPCVRENGVRPAEPAKPRRVGENVILGTDIPCPAVDWVVVRPHHVSASRP